MVYLGTGRRKQSTARVRLTKGTGKITVNGTPIETYLPLEILVMDVRQPYTLTDNATNFDAIIRVNGGGFSGQAGAMRLGIARALLEYNAELRKILKPARMLTRDAKIKERKKYGLKKARKAPQFSKR